MFSRKENTFMIATIVLSIILILVIGYVAYDKAVAWKAKKYQDILSQGYNQGVSDSVTQIFQRTNDCNVVPLVLQNETRNLADVACIQKAIAQAQTPAK